MIHIGADDTNSFISQYEPGDIQPNAIDVRLDKVLMIVSSMFTIDEQQKTHRQTKLVEPDSDGYWFLFPGTYEVVMAGEISIGPDEAGWIITRSTLNRNGVFITSGLYDSGYRGVMAGALHVFGGPIKIAKNTRVGQFLLFKSQAMKLYDGSYGAGTEHDKKYNEVE